MDAPAPEQSVIGQMATVAAQSRGWLKFLGILSILGGLVSALTIVGIIVAWLPIWMGVLLFQAGGQVDSLLLTKDPARLVGMLDKLRLYFVIQGVLALITIAITGISILIGGGAILSLLQSMQP